MKKQVRSNTGNPYFLIISASEKWLGDISAYAN
jgi:hypothetical protein